MYMFHLNERSYGVFTLPDTDTGKETNNNGLYTIVNKCSYCAEADTKTDSHWLLS